MAESENEQAFAPLCVWCSAPWSDENVKLEVRGSYSYESDQSDGYPAVRIICHECGKLMYEKSGYGNFDYAD